MTGGGDIVCAGRLYADIVLTGLAALPSLGRENYADNVAVTPGGGAFISAAHLRGLGRPAVLASALGSDPLSASLEPLIRAAGLSLELVERFTGGPQLTVALAVGDDRAFSTHRAGPSVPAGLAERLRSDDVRHLHVGELATLRDARWMLDAARGRGITVSLDVAWDDAVFRDRDAFALATSVDLIFPNASEASALTGLPADDADALLRAFAGRGPAIALKLGAAGAAFSDGRTFVRADSLPGPVLDATGAGDAFAAGFLDAWIDLAPAHVSLARAVACGSHAVRHAGGARTLPDRAAIDALARLVTFPLAATSVALGA